MFGTVILIDMGVETIPCIIWKEKDGFTPDRMVNRLSPTQEVRMIKQSLGELDEQTIAKALAVNNISTDSTRICSSSSLRALRLHSTPKRSRRAALIS